MIRATGRNNEAALLINNAKSYLARPLAATKVEYWVLPPAMDGDS
jgi:hypothetical protein